MNSLENNTSPTQGFDPSATGFQLPIPDFSAETKSTMPVVTTEHGKIVKLASVVAAGAISLGALGVGGFEAKRHFGGKAGVYTSAEDIKSRVAEDPNKLSASSTDQRFRATAITLLNDGFKTGSASFLKTKDGHIHLITAEHVARPYYDLPAAVHEQHSQVSVGTGSVKSRDGEAFVPGFGLLGRQGEPLFLDASGNSSSGEATDLFADIPLSANQEEATRAAEKDGNLSIPEVSTYQPAVGDVLYMPSANDGEKIPLLYTGNQKPGSFDLLPVVILDQSLDQQAAKIRFLDEIATQKDIFAQEQKQDPNLQQADDSYFTQVAATTFIKNFEKQYSYTTGKEQKQAEILSRLLPCHGDSGAPLLDSNGNTLGVLSQGSSFYDAYSFMRDNLGNQACLNQVTFDAIPKNL